MVQLIIKEAETEEELEKVFNLRYRVLCEEIGFLNPEDYPDNKEIDEYDKYSTHFVATRNGEVIATSRITPNIAGMPFMIETNTTIPHIFCRNTTVEFSRGMLLKQHRNMLGIAIKIMNIMYEYCKKHNFLHILAFANEKMFRLYNKTIPIEYSGTPVMVNGFKTHPLILRVENDIHLFRRGVVI